MAKDVRELGKYRAAVRPSEPVYAPDGTRLKYQELRQTTYYSINQFQRHLCFSLLGLISDSLYPEIAP
jgi:hypothetical protein